MVKKEITYTDFDGVERTETFYFNLSTAEITEMQLTYPGGLQGHLKRIIDAKDQPTIIRLTKDLLLMSVGDKSPDGKYFMKDETIRHRFECCPAYEKMFMMLALDDEKSSDFINALIPADLLQDVQPKTAVVKPAE